MQHSLSRARALDLREELLLDRIEEVGPKVARVQENIVLQRDLEGGEVSCERDCKIYTARRHYTAHVEKHSLVKRTKKRH